MNKKNVTELQDPYLTSFHKLLTDSAIPSTVAGCNQVCHAAALEERGEFRTAIKSVDEFHHFHQA